jgi:CubicO group peptidase (beta-lactamase class C family)
MRVKIHPTAFVATCALACAAWLAARPGEQVRIADKYMRAHAIATLFSGSVLVARGDDVIFSGAYGYADVERGIRNDVQTQFRIGSVTKPFTAITVLKLQESGLLSVTDPICKYFDPCPHAWSPITIHELLSHTSGIPDLTFREDYLEVAAKPASHDEIIATFRDLPLRFPVGEKFEYSNSNYHLLGWIIERVTGNSYGDALAERMLMPLGLSATFMDGSSVAANRVAVGYRPADDGSLKPDSRYDPAWSFASGGLFSTVEDLLRWSRALETDELLSASSRQTMWTPVKDTYGYGWNIRKPSPETLSRRVRMHSGRTPGYTACFVRFPDDDLTTIVLSNNVMADLCPIVRDLSAIMLGEPYAIPIARRAIRLPAATLDRYTGSYRYTDIVAINIRREDDVLVARLGASPDRYQLFAESETEFFLKAVDAQAVFTVNRAGEVNGLTLRYDNQSFFAKRLPRLDPTFQGP